MHAAHICYRIAIDAYYEFLADDGWAIASHIALSALMSLFPVPHRGDRARRLLFGSTDLADEVASLLLESGRSEVAVADRERNPQRAAGRRAATCSPSAWCSRSISHRAASTACASGSTAPTASPRRARCWLLKLESIAYVLVAAVALLVLAFLIVLAPLSSPPRCTMCPGWNRCGASSTSCAIAIAGIADRDRAGDRAQMAAGRPAAASSTIAPGIVVTLVLWLAGGILFGRYLAEFANNYVTIMQASPRR